MSKLITGLLLFLSATTLFGQTAYSDFFLNSACRVDFHFCGNAQKTEIYLDHIKQEPYWGGRTHHLEEDLNLGDYRFLLKDRSSNRIIYINGFSALYREWQSTPEALVVSKSFEQTIQFPFPKKSCELVIEKRTGYKNWQKLFSYTINPDDKLIDRRPPLQAPVKIIYQSAPPKNAIDIAVIAEGYRAEDSIKFYADARHLADNLFSHEPFKHNKKKINLYAIAAPSLNFGVSVPQDSVWKNTAVGSNFYTFYEPRYLTTMNVKRVYDFAALVPYDAVYILVNSPIYGGGGIYNFYTLVTTDHKYTPQVSVHEFGHSFGGLADEYFYEKQDVLAGIYDLKEEPWEPNITSLVQFDKKWKNNIASNIPIPTPSTDQFKGTIGVFEGGGYITKGMYRPSYDCRMRTNSYPEFCPVCRNAIEHVIDFLTQ